MSIFSKILVNKPGRNKFDLSNEHKFSGQMGWLMPIYNQEVLPGDKFRGSSEIMMRFAPMIAPIMHRVKVYMHFFFVPNRLIWEDWEDFITGGPDGTALPSLPKMQYRSANMDLWTKGTVADYLGLPVDLGAFGGSNFQISALPFRAYQSIYDHYYRDQNLEDEILTSVAGGNLGDVEVGNLLTLQQRAWEKDYFTSALPWAQRGPEVTIPVQHLEEARVTGPGGDPASSFGETMDITNQGSFSGLRSSTSTETLGLETVEGITVEDLRRSTRLQEWLERSARGGARYIEQILSHFGVRSSDSRLQRPEYCGGGVSNMVISEVLSTAEVGEGENVILPQGNMAGHGISVGRSNRFSKYFEEHGQLMGILSVLPKTAYQQGVERSFRKFDKFDFYWPEFAQLGEQEIELNEIYLDPAVETNRTASFGYTSRYAEYKWKKSVVSGDFRDDLKYWHMGRIFDSAPVLNEVFVKSDPTQRIFAITDETEHKLYAQVYNNISAIRPIPYWNIPKL